MTDTGSGWKATDAGPYRETDIYDGEIYDATLTLDQHPQTVTVYKGTLHEGSGRNGRGEIGLEEQRLAYAKLLRVTLRPAEHVIFDLGQNRVGVPDITMRGNAGTRLCIRFGEMLKTGRGNLPAVHDVFLASGTWRLWWLTVLPTWRSWN